MKLRPGPECCVQSCPRHPERSLTPQNVQCSETRGKGAGCKQNRLSASLSHILEGWRRTASDEPRYADRYNRIDRHNWYCFYTRKQPSPKTAWARMHRLSMGQLGGVCETFGDCSHRSKPQVIERSVIDWLSNQTLSQAVWESVCGQCAMLASVTEAGECFACKSMISARLAAFCGAATYSRECHAQWGMPCFVGHAGGRVRTRLDW